MKNKPVFESEKQRGERLVALGVFQVTKDEMYWSGTFYVLMA